MSTQPFDIGLVRDRIRQGVSEKELRQVQGSADYAAVTALRDFPAPCCYVLLAREMPLETKTRRFDPRPADAPGAVGRSELRGGNRLPQLPRAARGAGDR